MFHSAHMLKPRWMAPACRNAAANSRQGCSSVAGSRLPPQASSSIGLGISGLMPLARLASQTATLAATTAIVTHARGVARTSRSTKSSVTGATGGGATTAGPQVRTGAARHRQAEVAPGRDRRDASARRALQEALLDQVWLEHVLDRVTLFTDRRREVVEPDRAAGELLDHRQQQLAVHDVEADRVDVEHAQRGGGDRRADPARRLDL